MAPENKRTIVNKMSKLAREFESIVGSDHGRSGSGSGSSTPFTTPVSAKYSPKSKGGTKYVGGQNVERRYSQNAPLIQGMTAINGTTSMIVEKTEAISTVSATGVTFELNAKKIHPGSDGLLWLNTISKAFVEYQILEMEFTYVPTVPTNVAGAVMMAFTGDYQDLNPGDQTAFLQSEQALLGPVYSGTEGGRALQKFGFPNGDVVGFSVPKYTYCLGTTKTPQTYRIMNQAAFDLLDTKEQNLYSPGKLIWATQGIVGATTLLPVTVGQIFVRYRIRLLGSVKPSGNI